MSTIEDLEKQILQLKKEMQANGQTLQKLTQKSEKALDTALHAYKVDHYGIIWAWDTELQGYRKTQMRVCSPIIPDEAITTNKIADGAVTGSKIPDGAITTLKIADKAVKGKNIADDAITGDKIGLDTIEGRSIKNNTIEGRSIQNNAIGIQHLKPGTIDESKIVLSDVAIDFDNETGDITVYFINDCGVTDAYIDENTGDIVLVVNDEVA